MVTAIIMAGGSGNRTMQSVPKQFLTVNDVPVIVYTMKNLQDIPLIDDIIVVGPEGWEGFIYAYAKQFGISKLKQVVPGGKSRHDSIFNGLRYLKEQGYSGKICLCDGNRPMIPASVILETIALADRCDCATCLEPCYDSMFVSEDGKNVKDNAERSLLYKASNPECSDFDTMYSMYERATADQNTDMCAAGLFVHYGKKVMGSRGSIKCFKITTAEDFELFKALLDAEPLRNLKQNNG